MQAFSVTQFVEFVNTAFQSAVFPEGAIIEGEVAEYRVSQDKWIWFLLKDAGSVVSCFATTWQLRVPLEDGMQVRVFGTPKVHPRSGKFSVTVQRVEFVGEGALRRAFELLKKRLTDEGLFALERKRPLPRFPRRIGLITSREAAAYTDFLRILGDRWGGVAVSFFHVQVQGRDAVADIVRAFRHFNADPDGVEAIVLTRGGGSLEDLQAFNSEEVVRAVFGSRIPVVVGVGHERDETLADYAADVRAATPTNAAELLVPDREDVLGAIRTAEAAIGTAMRTAVRKRQTAVASASAQLQGYALRAVSGFRHLIRDAVSRAEAFRRSVAVRERFVRTSAGRMVKDAARILSVADASLAGEERLLRGLDPSLLLKRGYAVVRRGGTILRDASGVDLGAAVDIQLFRGGLVAEVTEKRSTLYGKAED